MLTAFISFTLISKNKLKNIAIFVSAVSILVFLIFSIEDLRSYIFDNHLSKIYGDSGSGVVRILNLQHSLDLFLSNPIIGIGLREP